MKEGSPGVKSILKS